MAIINSYRSFRRTYLKLINTNVYAPKTYSLFIAEAWLKCFFDNYMAIWEGIWAWKRNRKKNINVYSVSVQSKLHLNSFSTADSEKLVHVCLCSYALMAASQRPLIQMFPTLCLIFCQSESMMTTRSTLCSNITAPIYRYSYCQDQPDCQVNINLYQHDNGQSMARLFPRLPRWWRRFIAHIRKLGLHILFVCVWDAGRRLGDESRMSKYEHFSVHMCALRLFAGSKANFRRWIFHI